MDNKENKPKEKSQDKKLNEQHKKDLELFSKELSKRMSMPAAKRKSRGIFGSINPFIAFTTIILGGFLFFNFASNLAGKPEELSIRDLVNGLNDNRFSQLIVKDDGTIIAREKEYLFTEEEVNVEEFENLEEEAEAEELEVDDLVEKINSSNSLINKLRAFVGRESTELDVVIYGENFIVGVNEDVEPELFYIPNATQAEFREAVEEKGISLAQEGVEERELQVFGKEVEIDSLEERIESEQIASVITIEGLTIAEIKEEEVRTYTIDWTPSIYSFTDILIQEGFALDSPNFEIVTDKVPSSITLSDILTILTIAIFVVLAVVIFRSAQASGMGLMQFGQSKARMFFGQKTDTTFADVAGIDEAREELNEIVDFLKNPNKYRKLGARIPKGILMVGSPGTGKTLLARAIAGEAQVPFFHTSGSEFEEMLVGAGASRVRDLFAKAKKAAPSLIFIDEIDAVARKRGTRIQSGSTEQTLNQILVEMDGFEKNTNVIVLAATNRPDVLDPAILRPGRFDRQVRIELPDKDGRLEILRIHSKNKPLAADVDLEKIAKRTVGFSGADLENIMNEAAIIAAKEGKKEISTDDIEEAVTKVILGPAKKSRKRTDKELELVAYHEAGHALVAKMTKDAIPVDKISIVSRGSSGGVTMFLPEKDENIISRSRLLADLTVSLGGRAAEEVALDDISTGASADIRQATKVARNMIQKYGMSEKLGLVQYGQAMDSDYLGYAYDDTKEFSDKTAEMIDSEVRGLIEEAYARAVDIVRKNKEMLDKIAKKLLEVEVLDKKEFEEMFESFSKGK